MNQPFEFTLTNRTKLIFLVFGGIGAFLAGIAGLSKVASAMGLSRNVQVGVVLAVMAGGMYGYYRLIKRLAGTPVRITITAHSLLITPSESGTPRKILLTEIAAYQHSIYNSDDILRLKLRDGSRTKLIISGFFHGEQQAPFAAMVEQLEAELGKLKHWDGQGAVRERTFFEKPVSTFVLVAFTAFLGWVAWMVLTSDHPVRGGLLIGALGSYVAYIAAWLAARERRNVG